MMIIKKTVQEIRCGTPRPVSGPAPAVLRAAGAGQDTERFVSNLLLLGVSQISVQRTRAVGDSFVRAFPPPDHLANTVVSNGASPSEPGGNDTPNLVRSLQNMWVSDAAIGTPPGPGAGRSRICRPCSCSVRAGKTPGRLRAECSATQGQDRTASILSRPSPMATPAPLSLAGRLPAAARPGRAAPSVPARECTGRGTGSPGRCR